MESQAQPGYIIAERYQILGILGEGGTGTTYAAKDLQRHSKVAIKALYLRNLSDWKTLELFEREGRILSQLSHPAIPSYIDFFQTETDGDRVFYLVQDFAPGQSLDEWIKRGGHPDPIQVKHFAEKILTILVYLQDFTPPIFHRDIKPQNIIYHPQKGIFLVDFGSVQDTYRHTVTRGSTIVGTYGYMAPEQFRGKADLTTDLYGLGSTLLFLLTKQSPVELPRQQLKIKFRPYIELDDTFSSWLERMLEPASEDRFTSAKEALAVLRGEQPLLAKTAPKPRPPSFSPITVRTDNEQLQVEIPPIGLRSDRAQNFAIITFTWSGALALTIWSMLGLSLILSPVHYGSFALFVVVGLWMLRAFLYSAFSRTRIVADKETLHFQQRLWGMRHKNVKIQCNEITSVNLDLIIPFLLKEPFSVCEIRTQLRTHRGSLPFKIRFGSLLTPPEKEWLVKEVNAFLSAREIGADFRE